MTPEERKQMPIPAQTTRPIESPNSPEELRMTPVGAPVHLTTRFPIDGWYTPAYLHIPFDFMPKVVMDLFSEVNCGQYYLARFDETVLPRTTEGQEAEIVISLQKLTAPKQLIRFKM